MALVKKSDKVTNYYLPVVLNNWKTNWYYDDEQTLMKAFRQLKYIYGKEENPKIKPLAPVVCEDIEKGCENL